MKSISARTKDSGFTLLEVLVALFILFLVSVFIMALFTGGLTSFQKSRDFTTAVFLAQEKMEETLYQNQISPASGNFSGSFQEFAYTISVQPYNSLFNMVSVDVANPGGPGAHLVSLARVPLTFYGTSADQFSSTANLSNQPDAKDEQYNPPNFSLPDGIPRNFPGAPSGVAVDIFASFIWAGDQGNNTIAYYDGTGWIRIAKPPGMGTPTGVATDMYANIAFVADKTNKSLWKYDSNTPGWSRAPNASPPLGTPAGIATDHYANVVWIADADNNCLRLYNDQTGSWDPAQYAPVGSNCSNCSGRAMSSPRGVATTTYGDIAFAIDAGRILWEYNSNTSTWSVVSDLSSNNSIQSVSGLSTDAYGGTFWLNDSQSRTLWYYDGSTWKPNSY